MNGTAAAIVGLVLGAIGHPQAQSYYPGPQSGYYVYGPDHEYHLLSRNQPYVQLRPYCNPQWNPDCNVLPAPGYPLQPLIPLAPPPHPAPPLSMEQDREAVIRAGEEHCHRFNDPQVCHDKR